MFWCACFCLLDLYPVQCQKNKTQESMILSLVDTYKKLSISQIGAPHQQESKDVRFTLQK